MKISIKRFWPEKSDRMSTIRNDLAKHVQADFSHAFSPSSSKGQINFETIRNACLVADSLDESVRDGLIKLGVWNLVQIVAQNQS